MDQKNWKNSGGKYRCPRRNYKIYKTLKKYFINMCLNAHRNLQGNLVNRTRDVQVGACLSCLRIQMCIAE